MAEEKSLSIEVVKEMMLEMQRQNADMLSSVIQELKKPTVMEQKEIDKELQRIKDANEERRANSQGILIQMKDRHTEKMICSHKHREGQSHGVLVMERGNTQYIHCQKCHANIRPGQKPETNSDTAAIYSTELFNRVFQELPTQEMFG